MQWPLIHVSNCATFVGTVCMHVWALTGTLSYHYEDSPHWWYHRDTPVMSSGVGIPSLTVISFSTNSNTPLCSVVAAHTCIKLCHFCQHCLHACMSSNRYFILLFWGFPSLMMSWGYPSDVIRSGNSLSYNNKLWCQQQYPFIYLI